jgi:hypothetical protein
VDLATLVAACAFGVTPMAVPAVAPNVMHAFICEQSRGKPWSFTTSNDDQLRAHPTLGMPSVVRSRCTRATGSTSD